MTSANIASPPILRRYVAAHPALYRVAAAVRGHGQLVRSGDDIVIDGFPRSANSTAEAAFRLAQGGRPLRLAHHCHAPAQFLLAARLNVPAILLLRAPDGAVLSAAEAHGPGTSLKRLYRDYIAFHRPLVGREADFVIAPFEEVTRDFGAAVLRLNDRFGCRFAPPEAGEEFALRVAALRDQLSEARTGQVPRYSRNRHATFQAARAERRIALAAAQRHPGLARLRDKATRLHAALMTRHAAAMSSVLEARHAA